MLPALSAAAAAMECKTCRVYSLHFGSLYLCPGAGEELCSGGCETHGECSQGHRCDDCDKCETACQCVKCNGCDAVLDSWGDCPNGCCPHCSSQCCSYCVECEEPSCQCDCSSDPYGEGRSFGSIKVAPWVERGIVVDRSHRHSSSSARTTWGVDETIDLVQSAADFYLLEALTSNIVNSAGDVTGDDAYLSLLRTEAREMFGALVARLDRSFTGYLDMIIGGELRHHQAVRGTTLQSTDRYSAWNEWAKIRSAGGLSVLSDAVTLFEDFQSSSYGGEAWANIARVLLARLSGKISPAVFIDRCWNLQHNGGTCFNKIGWAIANRRGWDMGELNTWILPAHGASNPWPVLLSVASDEVRELFSEYWRQANRCKTAVGMRADRAPLGHIPMRTSYWGDEQPDLSVALSKGLIDAAV